MISLAGRVAVVTGAGGGLGRAYAKSLAARGAKVLVNDLGTSVDGSGSDESFADRVVEEILADGGQAIADHTSVSTPEGGESIVAHALEELGGVDILVNNAGNVRLSSFAKLDVRGIGEMLDVHLGGAFYVTQPAYRAMLPKRRGRIIFTTSGVAVFGNYGASVYGAAKGAIIGLLNVLALEGARHGITVNAVAPMAQTRMTEGVELSEYVQLAEGSVSADLVAPVVVYFASDECELTGELWSVGSGSVARLAASRSVGFLSTPRSKARSQLRRSPAMLRGSATWPALPSRRLGPPNGVWYLTGSATMAETSRPVDPETRSDIVAMVRAFVDEQVLPQAERFDREDLFPDEIVEQMKKLGLLGITIPARYGGMDLDLVTYAMIIEELARGWISIAGVVNTHLMGCYLLKTFGTDEQKEYFLPRMATGEIRGAFSLSEPDVGSDVQSLRAKATRQRDGGWELNGQKMWVTGSLRSSVIFVLMKSDPQADPPHRGITCFIAEKQPGKLKTEGRFRGITVSRKIPKMGYRGIETSEVVFHGYRCPADRVLGGPVGVGQGFRQMMNALETGRINVASRGVGIGQRALELALRYSQERRAFGKPIAEHQAITFKLADMATKVAAARLLTQRAALLKDTGRRCDLEAGMAKLFACEAGKEVVEEALRIHGGYGYSQEYEIERLYRDAPLLLIGEGTSDIQRMVIGRSLLSQHRI